MSELLSMRRAVAAEAERVMDIIEDGRRSIAALGIAQWQFGYPDLATIERDIAHGFCYVAEDVAGVLVGTLAICRGVDPEYVQAPVSWLTSDTACGDVPYVAIHRCATSLRAQKRGVMGFMFRATADLARAWGYQSIRIDTHPGNVAMRGFLTKQGFSEIGPFELATKTNGETDLIRIAYEKLV